MRLTVLLSLCLCLAGSAASAQAPASQPPRSLPLPAPRSGDVPAPPYVPSPGPRPAPAGQVDVTLGGVIDQVAQYVLGTPGWTDYRRQREAEQLRERLVGATISLATNINPRVLHFDQSANRTVFAVSGRAYGLASNTPQDQRLRRQLNSMLGDFVDSSGSAPARPAADYEEFNAGQWLLRVYNKAYFRSLGASQSVAELLARMNIPGRELALELTVLSPSDRWMMEVNGTTPATVVARIKSVDWGATSTSFLVRLEVEEISSRFR